MEFWIKAAQLILSLSILIVLHELGHFIPAKLFKTKVEKFYLFFDPWFSLFKYKKGDTEYGIGWIPLGGYVKIAGMIDESMDTDALKQEPKPWEFRSKPAWQRLIIMIGGVTVNVILAFVLYSMILFIWGKEYLPANNAKYGVHVSELASDLGFQEGDKVVQLNDKVIDNTFTYGLITKELLLDGAITSVNVIGENGLPRTIDIPSDIGKQMLAKKERSLFQERFPFVVDSVMSNSIAQQSGVIKGDKIIGIDTVDTPYFVDFSRAIKSYKNDSVAIKVMRGEQLVEIGVQLDSNAKIGAYAVPFTQYFDLVTKEYSFIEAIPAGVQEAGSTISDYLRQFKLIFTKEGAGEIGGFGTIGSIFPSEWNWGRFWELTAFLSIILAVMNILPIPALDGGHVMFLLYEIIVGKAPGEKFLERAQTVGMILLFGLLIYANGNDLVKWLFK